MTTLETHRPPYDLTANFLIVMTLSATAPLKQSFPDIPFLSVFGKTPFILWFSRITEACYYDQSNQKQCEQNTDQIPYTELNVVTLLNKRALFVPRIYASSELSVRVSSLYAMPKTLHALSWKVSNQAVESSLIEEGHQSFVHARVFQGGKITAKLLSSFLPISVWPAQFPAKGSVRAIIQSVPAVQLALIKQGQLSLPEPWLPEPVSFFPIGLSLPQLAMRLPPP